MSNDLLEAIEGKRVVRIALFNSKGEQAIITTCTVDPFLMPAFEAKVVPKTIPSGHVRVWDLDFAVWRTFDPKDVLSYAVLISYNEWRTENPLSIHPEFKNECEKFGLDFDDEIDRILIPYYIRDVTYYAKVEETNNQPEGE